NAIWESSGGATFNNLGTFAKSGGYTTSMKGTKFNNDNTVNVLGGTLELTGAPFTESTSKGTFSLSNGTTLALGNQELTKDSQINGADGTVAFTGPLNTVAGFYNTGKTIINSATIVDFGANATTASLDLTGGTLTGAGTVTVTKDMTWTGGTMEGTGTTNLQNAGATGTVNGAATLT